MEILKISKYAIRISLTTDEIKEYNIPNDLSLADEDMKIAFTRLLDKAKSEVDFSYAGRKIFTEIYPSRDGGCEIFISCIYTEDKEGVAKDKQGADNKKSKPMQVIFDFDSFDNLLCACHRLKEINFKKKSVVYYCSESKHYFMVLEDVYIKDIRFAFLFEYGKNIKANVLSYVNEHYKCIVKRDSVRVLSALL